MKTKPLIAIAVLAALAAAGTWHFTATPPETPADIAAKPTSTVNDAKEVFQKAFWFRPTPDDEILHAERREWADENGVSSWQWFIAVKPSAALTSYLRDRNPFQVRPLTGPLPALAKAPAWFPVKATSADYDITGADKLLILTQKAKGIIYACDSGGGFRAGVVAK